MGSRSQAGSGPKYRIPTPQSTGCAPDVDPELETSRSLKPNRARASGSGTSDSRMHSSPCICGARFL